MPHADSERLTTARLELAPLEPADADEMVGVLGDKRLYSFIGGRPPSLPELRSRYERLAACRSANGTEEWHNWIIRLRADRQPIGHAQATITAAGSAADVAWVVGSRWQGKGFASEAARAIVDWLEALGVDTITAHVHPHHHASAAVAANAGLVATGEVENGEQVWRRVRRPAGRPDGRNLRIRRTRTDELTARETEAIRDLLFAAFGTEPDEAFTEDDWQHALGGLHFLLEIGAQIVAHAAVVERELHVDGRPVRTGYVEAVATVPHRQRAGLGSIVMRDVAGFIRRGYELGALGTGSQGFYERLGWLRWQGPTYVRTAEGLRRTAEEDGYILVLPTPASPPLDLTAPISCEWRTGDVW
jgi:RimJ/RimL family protein N-acetyltransferase/predicted N-acetyltransferase YhbS